MSKTISKENERMINFLYYIHNFRNIEYDLLRAFGGKLGSHFYSKLMDKEENYISAARIIKLIMEMTDENKAKYFDYISENYSYKLKEQRPF
jgi:hypothetical protein